MASPAVRAQQTGAAGHALAVVNGRAITNAEVEAALGQSLARLEEQIYDLKKTALDALIDQALIAGEAKKRGVSAEALIEAEVDAKLAPVTDQQIAAFYTANQARLQKDLAGWRDEIRTFLLRERVTERREAFAKELRAAGTVDVRLPAPKIFRSDVSVTGAFARGRATAPVTVVEFSDFHCPFCKRVQPALTQLLAKYGDRVRLVYKDFPLDSLHPQARFAAEAARCAGEQGKFWEFHDKVYAGGSDGSPATMARYAREIAVGDLRAFEACVKARKYQTQVQRDVAEGEKLGVTGTPAFFINGRMLAGAQPFEAFASIVDAELAPQNAR
jgi:protein-disulfide isomerase